MDWLKARRIYKYVSDNFIGIKFILRGQILLLNHRSYAIGLVNCITLLLHNDGAAAIMKDVLWPRTMVLKITLKGDLQETFLARPCLLHLSWQ